MIGTCLRDYQQEMLERLHLAWKQHQSVMVQMPTGTGKTILLAEAIREEFKINKFKINKFKIQNSSAIASGADGSFSLTKPTSAVASGGVLVVAHRRELIDQISRTLDRFGIEHGLIVSGKPVDETKQVQVASIQTLSRRISHTEITENTEIKFTKDLKDYTDSRGTKEPSPTSNLQSSISNFQSPISSLHFSLIVIDEAHHAQAKTYRKLWEQWPEARFLGLTATPCRMGGQSFTDLFDTLLQSKSITDFIAEGWLSDFEYMSVRPDNIVLNRVRSLTKRGADGDYQAKEMALVLDCPESIAHLYECYASFARGKKGIVYAIDKAHARHISEYYCAQGVRCCWIEAKTPVKERQQLVEDYREGMIDVIVNVDIFTEGFDCPEVEFIQLARPTLSLSKYLQQVGRGMRVSPGKPHVLILDNVGLYQTFGLPTVERDWQQLFLGKEAGKGSQELTRLVVVDEENDKELVNSEMVRIKKVGQKKNGLEVFLLNGFYGVMRNGRITCSAKFKRVQRLQKGCGFFALGTYLMRNERDFGKLEEVTTVIDNGGEDLRVKLYGYVVWRKGYFYGHLEGGHYFFENSWDPVGNAYYDTDPNFVKVAGVEIGYANEHNSKYSPCMKLRVSTGQVSPRFNVWEMFYNKDIIIARDYLVVKRDHNHSYRISGYLDDSILVENEQQVGYQQIMPDGRKGQVFKMLPRGTSRTINHRHFGLRRVKAADND